jgi:two-component system response regulator QseB
MRLLLVEDDEMIGEAVRKGLRDEGAAVDWVQSVRHGEVALAGASYDAVLLDLGLPGGDGLSLLRALRTRRDDVPVLILTARDSISDRVAGLDAGADDYLVKPFALDELAARVRALLRRRAGRVDTRLRHGDLVLDPATREVTVGGEPVSLSAREYAVLLALMERPAAVLSRAQLEERVYGWGEEVGSNAVEVHVHALRRKLGAQAIRTIRGVGYTMTAAT